MFSDNMRKLADRMIKKFGDSIVLVETVKGAYDPDTGLTTDTITEHNIKGAISSFTSSDILPENTNIDDLMLMIYADDFKVTKAWNVKYDSQDYNIINVSKVTTQDSTVYYNLQLRGK